MFPLFQVSSRQKETSSTSGMRETVETSPLIQHRASVLLGFISWFISTKVLLSSGFPSI